MRSVYLLIFSFLIIESIAQDTTYHDEKWKEVNSYEKASFIYIITKNKNHPDSVVERTFYKNWQIRYERFYSSFDKGLEYGKDRQWYSNGNLKEVADYLGRDYHGRLITYWENGIQRRNDSLNSGKLIEGKCFSSKGTDTAYFDYWIMPYLDCYPGNEYDDHQEYISKNLKYPQKSKDKKIEGDIQVSFTVERDGTLSNFVVSQGINSELDKEAIRVMKSMPKWVPGRIDGFPSKFALTIPITFEIKKVK